MNMKIKTKDQMLLEEAYSKILKEEYSSRTDSEGIKRYYIHDDNVEIGSKYTGELLRVDFGCDWIDEEDDNTYFIIKDDFEVVKDDQDLLAKQARFDSVDYAMKKYDMSLHVLNDLIDAEGENAWDYFRSFQTPAEVDDYIQDLL